MKLVLDTNIYIAAFLAKGLAEDILRLGQRKKVDIFISPDIVKELESKLAGKFKLEQGVVEEFIGLVDQSTALVKPKQKLSVIKMDPDDDKILECAVEAEADLIISMDKHLLDLKFYQTMGIVHPKTLTWIIPRLLG